MESYEKKYKEALNRAKKEWLDNLDGAYKNYRERLEIIFPELKEGEDERIKKCLINWIKFFYDDNKEATLGIDKLKVKDIIAWLEKQEMYYTKKDVDDAYLKGITDTKNEIEKQYEADYQIRKDIATFIFYYKGDIKDRAKWMDYLGFKVSFVKQQGEKPQGKSALEVAKEEKVDNSNSVNNTPYDYENTNINQKDFAPKEGPKFHEGDWVASNVCNSSDLLHIIDVDDKDYEVETPQGNTGVPSIAYIDNNFHLWTIQDAKDGDVLQLGNVTAIFQECIGNGNCKCYCSVYNGEFKVPSKDSSYGCHNTIPATKEQRDLLFQKMREAGYEWDAEKKEVKEIEQNTAQWSISDFRTWQYIVCDVLTKHDGIGQYLDNGFCKKIAKYMQEEWSKKLSPVQPAEWSEEDETGLTNTIIMLKEGASLHFIKKDITKAIDWLKSLKERINNGNTSLQS